MPGARALVAAHVFSGSPPWKRNAMRGSREAPRNEYKGRSACSFRGESSYSARGRSATHGAGAKACHDGSKDEGEY